MNKINKSLIINRNFSKCLNFDDHHNIFYRGDITMKNISILSQVLQYQNDRHSNIDEKEFLNNPIKLHITSYGGDMEAGLLAYDILKLSKFPIHTYIYGYAASSATFLFLAGNYRFMTKHSKLLIHQTSYDSSGKHSEIKDAHYNAELLMKDAVNIYLKDTKINKEKLDYLLNKDVYLTSKECLKYGFVHKIL
jgi:ATP-dependent Clp protease protease subunit